MQFSSLGQRLTPTVITRLMKQALETPGLISLAAGFTDTQSLPVDFVRRATTDLLARDGASAFLQYGTNAGRLPLRQEIARRIATADRLNALPEEDVFLTNGSQQALFLALATLCDPGDIIFVQAPTYFVFLENTKALGLDVRSLPADESPDCLRKDFGQTLDALITAGEKDRCQAVYLVSYFANPSSRTLSAESKTALAETLHERDMHPAIIEDAAYRDLYFHTPAHAPGLFADPAFDVFPRLYLGTLTKPFASGLKVGYGICPENSWREKILALKGNADFGSPQWNQAILEYVLQKGLLEEHLERIRPLYAAKMNALDEALRATPLPDLGWNWERPEGGLYLWLEGPPGTDARATAPLFQNAINAGVLYVPGDLCFAPDRDGRRFVRLSFGNSPAGSFPEAARRFAQACRED